MDARTVNVTDLVTESNVALRRTQPVSVLLVVYPKVAVVPPFGMVAEAGVISPALLDRSRTVELVADAPVSDTMQLPELLGLMTNGVQVKDDNFTAGGGSAKDRVTFRDTDPKEAAITAS